MNRRTLLGGIGGAAAGAAIGVGSLTARYRERQPFLRTFRAARGRGKVMVVANVATVEEQKAFEAVEAAILKGRDRDLAVRLLLVDIQVTCGEEARRLFDERPKFETPWLAVIDGEEPRLGEQIPLDKNRFWQDIDLFLRRGVSLDPAWLDQRVALVWRDQPALVRLIRQKIADGDLKTDLARQAPAVVVLEAMRRTGDARDQLLAVLVPRPRREPKAPAMVDCGIAAMMMTPLGARFAATFTRRVRTNREPERKR